MARIGRGVCCSSVADGQLICGHRVAQSKLRSSARRTSRIEAGSCARHLRRVGPAGMFRPRVFVICVEGCVVALDVRDGLVLFRLLVHRGIVSVNIIKTKI